MTQCTDKRIFRKAIEKDIPQIQIVRKAVKENRLTDPSLVSDQDCEEFITERGQGWVCEIKGIVIAFAIADLRENNIWALFVHPEFEGRGIGRTLHDQMMNWFFSKTDSDCWLGTAPGTRAEIFYRKAGWTENGLHGKLEIKFEMKKNDWIKKRGQEPHVEI